MIVASPRERKFTSATSSNVYLTPRQAASLVPTDTTVLTPFSAGEGSHPVHGRRRANSLPPSPRLTNAPAPRMLNNTARILATTQAVIDGPPARFDAEDEPRVTPLVAFTKTVEVFRSPRPPVEGDSLRRRPSGSEEPGGGDSSPTSQRGPSPPRNTPATDTTRRPQLPLAGRSPQGKKAKPSPPTYLKQLGLYSGDQNWLFYPQQHHSQQHQRTAAPTAAPAATAAAATSAHHQPFVTGVGADQLGRSSGGLMGSSYAPPAAADGQHTFRKGSSIQPGAMLEMAAKHEAMVQQRARPIRQANTPPSVAEEELAFIAAGARAAAGGSLDVFTPPPEEDEYGGGAPRGASPASRGGSAQSARGPAPPRSSGRRGSHFSTLTRPRRRAEDSEIESHLTKIEWFKGMPPHEISTLMRRANHRMVPKYSTIIREGAVGSVFYVLLKGSVQVTNASGLDITLPAGVSFGEGALVTKVRREATVTANEQCHLVQLTSDACAGLKGVDLEALRRHLVMQMLTKLKFFTQVSQDRVQRVAKLLEIEYHPTNAIVFEQGDPGDKFYILNEGRVGIFHGQVDVKGDGHLVERGSGGDGAGGEEHEARQLGEFRSDDLHPWFGEGALMAPVGSGLAPRGASAIALEPTKLLSLPSGAFNEFLHALPSFLQMLQKDAAKYSQFNKLNDNLHAAAEERERQRLQAREEVE